MGRWVQLRELPNGEEQGEEERGEKGLVHFTVSAEDCEFSTSKQNGKREYRSSNKWFILYQKRIYLAYFAKQKNLRFT